MNQFNRCKPRIHPLISAWLLVFSASVSAVSQDITARFIPDPANPMRNEFVNTTPQSGVCEWHGPAIPRCKAEGIFSIRINDFFAESNGVIRANHANPREGAMWKVPSEWRNLQVTHRETGEVETVTDATTAAPRAGDVPRVGRNEPCPCGSGKKFKQCHGKLD